MTDAVLVGLIAVLRARPAGVAAASAMALTPQSPGQSSFSSAATTAAASDDAYVEAIHALEDHLHALSLSACRAALSGEYLSDAVMLAVDAALRGDLSWPSALAWGRAVEALLLRSDPSRAAAVAAAAAARLWAAVKSFPHASSFSSSSSVSSGSSSSAAAASATAAAAWACACAMRLLRVLLLRGAILPADFAPRHLPHPHRAAVPCVAALELLPLIVHARGSLDTACKEYISRALEAPSGAVRAAAVCACGAALSSGAVRISEPLALLLLEALLRHMAEYEYTYDACASSREAVGVAVGGLLAVSLWPRFATDTISSTARVEARLFQPAAMTRAVQDMLSIALAELLRRGAADEIDAALARLLALIIPSRGDDRTYMPIIVSRAIARWARRSRSDMCRGAIASAIARALSSPLCNNNNNNSTSSNSSSNTDINADEAAVAVMKSSAHAALVGATAAVSCAVSTGDFCLALWHCSTCIVPRAHTSLFGASAALASRLAQRSEVCERALLRGVYAAGGPPVAIAPPPLTPLTTITPITAIPTPTGVSSSSSHSPSPGSPGDAALLLRAVLLADRSPIVRRGAALEALLAPVAALCADAPPPPRVDIAFLHRVERFSRLARLLVEGHRESLPPETVVSIRTSVRVFLGVLVSAPAQTVPYARAAAAACDVLREMRATDTELKLVVALLETLFDKAAESTKADAGAGARAEAEALQRLRSAAYALLAEPYAWALCSDEIGKRAVVAMALEEIAAATRDGVVCAERTARDGTYHRGDDESEDSGGDENDENDENDGEHEHNDPTENLPPREKESKTKAETEEEEEDKDDNDEDEEDDDYELLALMGAAARVSAWRSTDSAAGVAACRSISLIATACAHTDAPDAFAHRVFASLREVVLTSSSSSSASYSSSSLPCTMACAWNTLRCADALLLACRRDAQRAMSVCAAAGDWLSLYATEWLRDGPFALRLAAARVVARLARGGGRSDAFTAASVASNSNSNSSSNSSNSRNRNSSTSTHTTHTHGSTNSGSSDDGVILALGELHAQRTDATAAMAVSFIARALQQRPAAVAPLYALARLSRRHSALVASIALRAALRGDAIDPCADIFVAPLRLALVARTIPNVCAVRHARAALCGAVGLLCAPPRHIITVSVSAAVLRLAAAVVRMDSVPSGDCAAVRRIASRLMAQSLCAEAVSRAAAALMAACWARESTAAQGRAVLSAAAMIDAAAEPRTRAAWTTAARAAARLTAPSVFLRQCAAVLRAKPRGAADAERAAGERGEEDASKGAKDAASRKDEEDGGRGLVSHSRPHNVSAAASPSTSVMHTMGSAVGNSNVGEEDTEASEPFSGEVASKVAVFALLADFLRRADLFTVNDATEETARLLDDTLRLLFASVALVEVMPPLVRPAAHALLAVVERFGARVTFPGGAPFLLPWRLQLSGDARRVISRAVFCWSDACALAEGLVASNVADEPCAGRVVGALCTLLARLEDMDATMGAGGNGREAFGGDLCGAGQSIAHGGCGRVVLSLSRIYHRASSALSSKSQSPLPCATPLSPLSLSSLPLFPMPPAPPSGARWPLAAAQAAAAIASPPGQAAAARVCDHLTASFAIARGREPPHEMQPAPLDDCSYCAPAAVLDVLGGLAQCGGGAAAAAAAGGPRPLGPTARHAAGCAACLLLAARHMGPPLRQIAPLLSAPHRAAMAEAALAHCEALADSGEMTEIAETAETAEMAEMAAAVVDARSAARVEALLPHIAASVGAVRLAVAARCEPRCLAALLRRADVRSHCACGEPTAATAQSLRAMSAADRRAAALSGPCGIVLVCLAAPEDAAALFIVDSGTGGGGGGTSQEGAVCARDALALFAAALARVEDPALLMRRALPALRRSAPLCAAVLALCAAARPQALRRQWAPCAEVALASAVGADVMEAGGDECAARVALFVRGLLLLARGNTPEAVRAQWPEAVDTLVSRLARQHTAELRGVIQSLREDEAATLRELMRAPRVSPPEADSRRTSASLQRLAINLASYQS